ncbi:hypothetical protein Rsub_08573 [Raphidocelis subcapitata]|uniref:Uncharacterized protein n=1 Tax=Raphidocelis subcapitata TaxID=307507 RepID=A0A2V0P9G6_9CHLO|nr:hypothetical protein Rsub_08573 [Raphidocelis subcapitata]|eukprot:GBF95592.1 hypothetical protein Rsub_08573 [Raphidocelis subcapitata]
MLRRCCVASSARPLPAAPLRLGGPAARRWQPPAAASGKQPDPAGSDEDDPTPDGIDPSQWHLLGISLDSFLEQSCSQNQQYVKARCVGAAAWGTLAAAGFTALGGLRGYFYDRWLLTSGGALEGNFNYVWLCALAYFAVKSGAMALATAAWAHALERKQPPDGTRRDGAAWWRFSEARRRRDAAAAWTFVECAVASTLLAGGLYLEGGSDTAQLTFETLDEGSLCRLTTAMCLFWESYLAGISAMGAGGKAAVSDAARQRLVRIRTVQQERRQARLERLRRISG